MSFYTIIAGITGIWFLAVTIPGPNFLVISQSSLAHSRKTGFFLALGVSTAATVWALSSLLGLKAVFESATWIYTLIKLTGGVYLISIGLKLIWSSGKQASLQQTQKSFQGTSLQAFGRGLLTSFSNPKTAIFFGSIFGAAFPPQAPHWVYCVIILMVFSVSLFWYGMVAFFFSTDRIRQTYQLIAQFTNKMTGIIMIALGLRLVLFHR